MNKRFRPIAAFLVLTIAVMACGLPAGNSGDGPSTSDQVATIVASTLQALTPVGSDAPTITPEPAPNSILPHVFYYTGNDDSGLIQVFRIERDGVTSHQVTFESTNVGNFDASQIDGSVAYIVNNQILLINADGSGRRVLVDGGAVDPNDQFETSISNPVFSPNGQTLAYGLRGLNLVAVSTGVSNPILPQQVNPDTGFPGELYIPEKYSPDGTKLLITIAIPNSDGISGAIYYPATNSLVRITGGDGFSVCCGRPDWTLDSSALFTASSSIGMFGSGLWQIDAATGNVTTLLPTDTGGGNYNLASEPYLAPDGQLYFFYVSAPAPDGFIDRAPLQLVRSAPDGVTGRTVVNADNFQLMNDALWAPDASFVIVAFAPIQDVSIGGQAEVTYLDGRPSIVLTTYAQNMKWGP